MLATLELPPRLPDSFNPFYVQPIIMTVSNSPNIIKIVLISLSVNYPYIIVNHTK